jgi:hypothetical protein
LLYSFAADCQRETWGGGSISAVLISKITITPVAFADPPLLNSVGVHEPWARGAVLAGAPHSGRGGRGETKPDEKHQAPRHPPPKASQGAHRNKNRER